MKLICELNENVRYIEEAANDTGKKSMYIEGVFIQANVTNRNGRRYPMQIVEKEVNRYIKEHVATARALGELGHPSGPSINLDRVSHLITELKFDGSDVRGRAKLMDTPMGNIARNLIEEGVRIGVSTRGMGSLKSKDGIMEVQDDFFLATAADIVADPSAPDAFVQGIMEGVEWIWDNGVLVQRRCEQLRQEIDEHVRSRSFDERKAIKVMEQYLNTLAKSI